jgi:RND family efflux transporter MFP subunit
MRAPLRARIPVALVLAAGLVALATITALLAQGGDVQLASHRAPANGSGEVAPFASGRVIAEGRLAAYPGAEITVAAEVGGVLASLPFAERERVEKGDFIAQLRADDLIAELAAAEARVTEAAAEIRLAESELERAEGLYAKQIDTASRRDRAQRDLDVAKARRATAAAEVRRLEAKWEKTRIVAPIDGVVLRRLVDPDETVEAGQPIAVIADLGRVRIEAEVDEYDAGRIELGQTVEIRAEGYDGRLWAGVVEEIPDAVSGRVLKPQDPGRPSDTRILLVKIRLEEPTPLKLGQRVEVAIAG